MLCTRPSPLSHCPKNYTCLPDIGDNPNFGYTSFDHFGWAMLNSFQLITLDFWEDIYNKVWFACSVILYLYVLLSCTPGYVHNQYLPPLWLTGDSSKRTLEYSVLYNCDILWKFLPNKPNAGCSFYVVRRGSDKLSRG